MPQGSSQTLMVLFATTFFLFSFKLLKVSKGIYTLKANTAPTLLFQISFSALHNGAFAEVCLFSYYTRLYKIQKKHAYFW